MRHERLGRSGGLPEESEGAGLEANVGILLKIGAVAVGVWVAVRLIGGLEFEGEWWALLVIALLFGVVNTFIRPIVTILAFPLVMLTLGLFMLVINAAMFGIVVWASKPDLLDLGLTSTGFGATFLGAIIVSVVAWAINSFTRQT